MATDLTVYQHYVDLLHLARHYLIENDLDCGTGLDQEIKEAKQHLKLSGTYGNLAIRGMLDQLTPEEE